MFHCRQVIRRISLLLTVLPVFGILYGCATTLPEIVALVPWQEVLTLNTRPGVTMRLLLMIPDAAPKAIFLHFPGGEGEMIERSGRARGMFLPRRSRQIVNQGFVSAAVDVPSDMAYGMNDQFRVSKEHLDDIRKVVEFLSSKWSGPIFVIGISRGTLSAAHAGIFLKHPRVQGIVLASSLTGRIPGPGNQVSLFDLPLEKITSPVLILHHRDDGCGTTTFHDALRLPESLTGSARVTFIEVSGGDPPQSEPCLLFSAHGFLGKEREVITTVVDWATGKQVLNRIGP